MPRHALRSSVALLAAALLALSACGGSGSESSSGSDGGSGEKAEATTTTAPAEVRAAAAGEVATGEPVPSAGCGTTEVRSEELAKHFLDDSDRWYLLTTPLAHDGRTPLPLVLDFHGLSEGADIHSRMSEMSPFALENDFVLALPNGTGTPVRWQIVADRETNTDLQYTDEVLDQIENELCIDTSRIYATGLSNGAMISSAIGCTMADRFAAIAPVAGVMHASDCDPGRNVPVLSFHGTDDPILLFNGGVGDRLGEVMNQGIGEVEGGAVEMPEADLDGEGYPASMQEWATQNGCEGSTDEDLTETVMVRTWDCPADGATEFVILKGGGHSWPGSEFSKAVENIVGPTDNSIEANDLIWAFFQRFQLPTA